MLIISDVLAITQKSIIENPLKLQTAIKLSQDANLVIKQLELKQKLEENNLKTTLTNYDTNINLNLKLEQKDRFANNINSSSGYLSFNKALYNQDTNLLLNINNTKLAIIKQTIQAEKIIQEIKITKLFFDVILTDLKQQAILEKLAVFAVKESKIKDKFTLEEISDVELLEATNKTQIALTELTEIEAQQISTRANLARFLGLNFDNNLDELILPDLTQYFNNKTIEFKELKTKILHNNVALKIMKNNIQAIKQTIKQQQNNYQIAINSYLKVGKQVFETDKNGNWIAGIELSIPLSQSSKAQKINELNIKLQQQQNLFKQQQEKIIQQGLELYLQLKTLKQDKKSLTIQLEYRDFYLEKARTNYELDLISDIGDSMYQYTNTEYLMAKTNFAIVIGLKQLQLLTGEI